jgi:serine/threonine protein kinase
VVGADDLKRIVLSQGTIGAYHSIEFLSNSGYFSVVFRSRRSPGNTKAALKFFVDPTNDAYRSLAFTREGNLLWGPLRGEERFVQLVDAPAKLEINVPLPTGAIKLQFPYLAFEWMNGGDTEALVASPLDTHADLGRRLECFREMVRAVARLHYKQCFHRDLKPGNFLIENTSSGPRVKLGDFGTIRFADGSPPLRTEYHGPVGDLRYSAPELYSGVDIPAQWHRSADVYSLGAILFELLTKQQLIAWTFGSISQARDFFRHMMAMQPSQRLSSFNGFLEHHGHVLPKARNVNRTIPRCVAQRLDDVLAGLCEFDYRRRSTDLGSVVRSIDICRLTLANEAREALRLQRRGNQRSTP